MRTPRRRTAAVTLTAVGRSSHAVDVFAVLISLAAFIGTALQMLVALVEAREAHRPALQVAKAENELAHEVPVWRRRKVLHELRSWRDAETERSLAYVDVVLLSWTLLAFASGAVTIQSLAAL